MTRNVFTIPSNANFITALADGLWRLADGNNFKLSESLILLPTRRSCRALHRAFLERMEGKATLLPRMQPLGDIDEEELYFADTLSADIPPAITPLRRQLLLTQMISASDQALPLDQALQLASALALLLDQVQIERCSFDRLEGLVEDGRYAKHWEETVRFLKILTEHWPKVLENEGVIDPADRRNRLITAQANAWRQQPPKFPIIAAGSTGSMPATRDLLDTISSLSLGSLILPGLDQSLDETAWQAITEAHPQYGMKFLLDALKLDRASVKTWDGVKGDERPRVKLLNEAMRPAEVTEEWRRLRTKAIPGIAFEGLTRLDCDHPQEEAQVLALIIREALEEPKKTVALVTADRHLAERVGCLLTRWTVVANDSAGHALALQPVGAFLLDVLAAAAPHAGATDYLSLLKHPFAACGLSPVECRAHARHVELHVWRTERPETSEWLDALRGQLKALTSSWHKKLPLAERIQAHTKLAEELAASDSETGAARLWQGEAGEAASTWLNDWQSAAIGFPLLTGDDYRNLFASLLRTVMVRPAYGQHPRLSILGPLEARLLHADLIILGGLNEGSWPPETAVDPWMSRPMKQEFGLPSPERRIGLAAHDFVQLASASHVVLTRAKRAGNAPTVPSRFLLQLETVLRASGHAEEGHDPLAPREAWRDWVRMLDEPTGPPEPCQAPEPRPPVEARPRELSVTEIGTWQRNPYAIYAKHILKLRKLEPLDAEIDAADRGNLIHRALDRFIKAYPENLPADALEKLCKVGRDVFAAYEEHPEVKAFWWPRFERIADWFIIHERGRRASGIHVVKAEAKGRMRFGDFELKGRADRIDALPEGGLAIIDYKTGSVPKPKDIKSGYEPQLPLLALIAKHGGFENIPASATGQIAYWKLSGGRDIAEEIPVEGDPALLAEEARAGLEQLIKAFADSSMPYRAVPKPRLQPRYDDYAHLARLAEWARPEEEE